MCTKFKFNTPQNKTKKLKGKNIRKTRLEKTNKKNKSMFKKFLKNTPIPIQLNFIFKR